MNIIKSDLVNAAYDVYWEGIQQITRSSGPRPVLILTNSFEPGSQEEIQLMKMIDACKLASEQYNIIQLSQEDKPAWHQLRERLDPKIIFMIGIYPDQLGISALFALNVPNNFNDRVWLPTLSINELEQYKDTKKQLWINGITPIFVHQQFGKI